MVAKAQEAAPPWRAKIGRARRLLLPIGLLILGFVICLPTMGAKMFDPNEFSANRLFQALVELRNVERQGILTVDVTDIFASNLSGSTYPELVAWVHELGVSYPAAPVPEPGATKGLALEYRVLRRLPRNQFKAYDLVSVSYVISTNSRIQVAKATWVNTAAFP